MQRIFVNHPKSMGETYYEHFKKAMLFSYMMTTGGIACLIHAIFPCFFLTTGSDVLFKMLHRIIERAPNADQRMLELKKAIEAKSNHG